MRFSCCTRVACKLFRAFLFFRPLARVGASVFFSFSCLGLFNGLRSVPIRALQRPLPGPAVHSRSHRSPSAHMSLISWPRVHVLPVFFVRRAFCTVYVGHTHASIRFVIRTCRGRQSAWVCSILFPLPVAATTIAVPVPAWIAGCHWTVELPG